MKPDQFAVLQAEFEAISARLKQTRDPNERRTLLREMGARLFQMQTVVADLSTRFDDLKLRRDD